MIEEILEHSSPKTLLVALFAVFALVKVTKWVNNERKIRALGGHTYRVKTWIPGGTYPPLRLLSNKPLTMYNRFRTHLPRGTRDNPPQESRSMDALVHNRKRNGIYR
jgi:hypothetical protein